MLFSAVFVSFTVGKPLGVVGFSWLALRSGIAIRPPDLGWRFLVCGGMLAGIGFTLPLFIADLALATDLIGTAKLSVLLASTTSAVVGLSLLVSSTPKA
jgi:NhaA family Na+:H+ antiporter